MLKSDILHIVTFVNDYISCMTIEGLHPNMVKALSVMREGTCRHMCTLLAPTGDRAGDGATPASTQPPHVARCWAALSWPRYWLHSRGVCLQGELESAHCKHSPGDNPVHHWICELYIMKIVNQCKCEIVQLATE